MPWRAERSSDANALASACAVASCVRSVAVLDEAAISRAEIADSCFSRSATIICSRLPFRQTAQGQLNKYSACLQLLYFRFFNFQRRGKVGIA
jgi:hypothetical protein